MRSIRSILLPVILALSLGQVNAQEQKTETLRPEVGKHLQAAQELIKAQKYKEALAKVQEADAVSGKTAYEGFIIERMRGVAAGGAGDTEIAARAFDAVISSGRLPEAEKLRIIESMAGTSYRMKDYPRAITWANRYFKEGGTNPLVRTVLAQAYYLGNDFANAAKESLAEIQAAEKAGSVPSEDKLQLLASAYAKQNDNGGYATALEKLVTHYPKKDYWGDLISRIQKKPGFSDRLSLDVYRLALATGNLAAASEYMEMIQLAIQAGYPAEAKKIADQGFASGVLGTGADAERHQRLRDLAAKQVAEDQKIMGKNESDVSAAKEGTGLVNVGYAYVTLGESQRGLKLMEQGLQKGGVRRPDDAKLHLGVAYYLAGQKAKAVQAFKTVQGSDGTADLARLWILLASRP